MTTPFSPDGQFIATSGEKGDLKLLQANTRSEIRRFDPLGERLHYLTFSRDGRLLAGLKVNNQRVCIQQFSLWHFCS
ncbi:MAG: hypothetical protein EXS31_17370 [Pedosphaera sp.]|nr:hypothetical protein [Pedosphaera sp.]